MSRTPGLQRVGQACACAPGSTNCGSSEEQCPHLKREGTRVFKPGRRFLVASSQLYKTGERGRSSMQAALYYGKSDVRIETVPDPAAPGPGEVVLAVLSASICGTDVSEYMHGPLLVPLHERHPSSRYLGPVILGHEFVGRIVALGPEVTGLALGQRVVPGAGNWCGQCPR